MAIRKTYAALALHDTMTRSAVAHWAAAVVVGIVGVALHSQHQPAPLADAVSCPGLLELASVAGARLAPDVALASIFRVANAFFVIAALVAIVRLALSGTSSIVIGSAIGLAVAATPILVPAMAPSNGAAIAVTAGTMWAIASRRSLWLICLGFALCSSVTPSLAMPFAPIAAWTAWLARPRESSRSRGSWAGLAAAGVLVSAFAVVWLLPALPLAATPSASPFECLASTGGVVSAGAMREALRAVFAGVGPFALCVAALGAFSARAWLRRIDAWPLILMAVVPVVAATWQAADHARLLAPAFVAFWWLASIGLLEIGTALGHSIGRRIAASAFVLAVPVLQFASLRDPAVARPEAMGHEHLSGHAFAQLVRTIAPDSVLVIDDAVTEILVRSAEGTPTFAAKRLTVVSRRPDDINAALTTRRVLAFPRAQLDLQREGFQLRDQTEPNLPGVAEVLHGGGCAPVTSTWVTAPALVSSAQFALVAKDADVYGPIVVYLGSDRPLQPRPIDWPDRSLRGFFVSRYDQTTDRDRQRLIDDAAIDRAPTDHAALQASQVTRLELWRVPGAPLRLVVGLDHSPAAALTRTVRGDPGDGVRVCPSFEHVVLRLQDVR